jgi:hypothetical protein
MAIDLLAKIQELCHSLALNTVETYHFFVFGLNGRMGGFLN